MCEHIFYLFIYDCIHVKSNTTNIKTSTELNSFLFPYAVRKTNDFCTILINKKKK
jgi:hypothetical protein